MTSQQLQQHIAELQNKARTLEQEAVAHEQAARHKRAERDAVKVELAELGANLTQIRNQEAAQQAMAAAEQARQHAESHATTLAAEIKAVQQLRQELEAIKAATAEQATAAASDDTDKQAE